MTRITFIETGEEREVVGGCAVCKVDDDDAKDWPERYVISPTGVAHHVEMDTTVCGHNATGDGWWWAA